MRKRATGWSKLTTKRAARFAVPLRYNVPCSLYGPGYFTWKGQPHMCSIQNEIAWDDWYDQLRDLAGKHNTSVADKSAWYECFESDMSPEDAFYDEYPELRPKSEKKTKKQHTTPCRQCPWRRNSAPGWLGASEPGEFLAQSDANIRMPCHTHVDYEAADWEVQTQRVPQCAGRAIFQANRCQLPAPENLKLPADRQNVFQWPHEFVAHHAGVPAESLYGKLVYDLYKVTKK
jgi:hypothetical protein